MTLIYVVLGLIAWGLLVMGICGFVAWPAKGEWDE